MTGTANPTKLTLNTSKSVTAYFSLKAEGRTVQQVKRILDESGDVLVLDVSTAAEYATGHLLCAKNYVWNGSSFSPDIATLSSFKDEDILVYDQTGAKSSAAARYLADQGFNSVYYMTSGLNDWMAEGYETFTTAQDGDVCTSLAPLAYAGEDQGVNENVRVTLKGSGMGSGLSYEWNQVEGQSVTLSSNFTAQPTFTAPDLNGGNAHLVFRLTVEDSRGNKDADEVNVFVAWANSPPIADAGPHQMVAPGAQVTLDGSRSTDLENSIASYQWERSSVFGGGAFPVSLTGPQPSFMAPSTEGWVIYKLTVVDNGGLTDTDTVKVTVSSSGSGSETSPHAPSGLAANAVSYKQIRLRWTDESDNEDGFIIYRRLGFCGAKNTNPYVEIARVPSTEGANIYYDEDFTAGLQYSYQARAYNGKGNSEYSNCSQTTSSAAGTPTAPVQLTATYINSSAIELSWQEWSRVTGFEVYRQVNSGPWTLLDTVGPDVRSYSDETAVNNQSTFYAYKIQACNDKGCSPETYSAGVPAPPTTLTAEINSRGQVVLSWDDVSDDNRGYEIERKTGAAGTWTPLKKAGKDSETVTDGTSASGVTNSYRIRAYCRSWGIPYVYGYSDWIDSGEIAVP